MKYFFVNLKYALGILKKDIPYIVIYIMIIGIGTYGSLFFFEYVNSNYIEKNILLPQGSSKIVVFALEKKNDFFLFIKEDVDKLIAYIQDRGKLAPTSTRQLALKSTFFQEVTAGIGIEESFANVFRIPLLNGSLAELFSSQEPVCILSYEASQKFFNSVAEPETKITINGRAFKIVGITPEKATDFLAMDDHASVVLIPGKFLKEIDQVFRQNPVYRKLYMLIDGPISLAELNQFMTSQVLVRRDVEQRNGLSPLKTLDKYIAAKERDHVAETLLLLLIVSFGFVNVLVSQINFSVLYTLGRIRSYGILQLVGASNFSVWQMIFVGNLLLSSLGICSVLILDLLGRIIFGLLDMPVIRINLSYLVIPTCFVIVFSAVSSFISMVRLKSIMPMQIIQKGNTI